MNQKVLVIGSVWIEPKSSAAGSRMLQLVETFLEQNWEVHFACVAQKNPNAISLESLGVYEHFIELNNTSFDVFINNVQPNIVVFDRFMTEEQFGWRVAEQCPDAVRILDTEDLHCLRKTRHECFKKNKEYTNEDLLSSDIAKREIASILRSDISLIISSAEMKLLQEVFQVPASILCELPFWIDELRESVKSYEERVDFVSIGNFMHAPNLDATLYLKNEIWPLIRKELPNTKMHIYGAYPNQQVQQLHKEKEGFLIHGFVEDAQEVVENARLLLAPLRFGAGLKGKLLEAMYYGTPNITTKIGAEGMQVEDTWSGAIADETKSFAEQAISLYQNESLWNSAQRHGFDILNRKFLKESHQLRLVANIRIVQENLSTHRTKNFMGSLLQHHSLQSSKYLSKWIEAKNKS